MVTPAPFSQSDQDRLLRVLGEARRELTSTAIGMPRRSLLKAGAETVVDNRISSSNTAAGFRDHCCPVRRLDTLGSLSREYDEFDRHHPLLPAWRALCIFGGSRRHRCCWIDRSERVTAEAHGVREPSATRERRWPPTRIWDRR